MVSDLICVGVITGARGVQGEIKIKSYTAVSGDLFRYGPLFNKDGSQTFKGRQTGQSKDQVLARIKGIEDRTQAEKLKGLELYIPREALPEPDEDEFYYSDLIDMKAELIDGRELGTVQVVHDAGAGPSLEIKSPDGLVLVPFTKAAVPVVDMEGGKIVIDPPDGLMDPPEPEEPSKDESS